MKKLTIKTENLETLAAELLIQQESPVLYGGISSPYSPFAPLTYLGPDKINPIDNGVKF